MDAWAGKWKKVRTLPGGGQSDTYVVKSAEDSAREGVLKEGKATSTKVRIRMMNEVAHLILLHYAGVKVPRVLDAGNTSDQGTGARPWFVMEYIPGKTLDAALQDSGPLNLDKAIAITLDLSSTITQVHRVGLLHRDVKPGNLMIRSLDLPDVVLIDCGLSFEKESDGDLTKDDPIRNKFLSLSEGNSPGGNRRDPRSDLTAVAGILLYCLTRQNIGLLFDERGLLPHRRPDCTMQRLLTGDARRRQVELFFDRAFAPDINSRFQTPEELVSRLAPLADQPTTAFRNPLDVANHRAAELRQRHRRTQLAEYGQHFQKTVNPGINNWIDQTLKNLTRPYQPGRMSLSDINEPLPYGMETMWFEGNAQSVLFGVLLGYYGHPNTWHVAARTGVRGAEGVLLGLISRINPKSESVPQWEELMVFNPTELPPVEDFTKHFSEALSRAIDELSDDVERT